MAKGICFPDADKAGEITNQEYRAILELFQLAAAAKIEDAAASSRDPVPSEMINLNDLHFDLNAVHFPAADEATKANNLKYSDFLLPLIKESPVASSPLAKPKPAAVSDFEVVMAADSVVNVVINMRYDFLGSRRLKDMHYGNEALYNVFLRWWAWTQPHISFGNSFSPCKMPL